MDTLTSKSQNLKLRPQYGVLVVEGYTPYPHLQHVLFDFTRLVILRKGLAQTVKRRGCGTKITGVPYHDLHSNPQEFVPVIIAVSSDYQPLSSSAIQLFQPCNHSSQKHKDQNISKPSPHTALIPRYIAHVSVNNNKRQ